MTAAGRDLLRRLWCEVLDLESVSDEDDYFSLGGNSIKAMLLARRIEQETGQRLRLVDLIRHPTVAGQSGLLENPDPVSDMPLFSAPADYRAAAAIQRDLFILDQLTRREERAHMTTAHLVDIDIARQQGALAFAQTLRRHEILRTVFSMRDDRVVTEPGGPGAESGFALHRLEKHSLQGLYEEELARPLDIENGPLVRLVAVPVRPGRSVLLLSIHHIVSDGFSAEIFVSDFISCLRGHVLHEPPGFGFRDYACSLESWLAGPGGLRSREFWRARLADYRKPTLFPVETEAARNSFTGSRTTIAIDPPGFADLTRLCAATDASLFVVLLSLIRAAVFLDKRAMDLVIGCAASTRDRSELDGEIGPFVNTLPIRLHVRPDQSLRSVIAGAKEASIAAFEHKHVPLETILQDLAVSEPLFDIGFTLQNQARLAGHAQPFPRRPAEHSELISTMLWFVAWECDEYLELDLHYRKAGFTAAEAQDMVAHFATTLKTLVDEPDTPLSELSKADSRQETCPIEFDFSEMWEPPA